MPGPTAKKAGAKKKTTAGGASTPAAPPAAPKPPVDLDAELAEVLEDPPKALGSRIRELKYHWSEKGLDVRGNFYYMALRDGKPTVEEFVKLLYHQVPYFCLTRKDRKKHIDEWQSSGELYHMQEMFDKARKLLIRSKESGKTVGEPGEIILYILLEGILRAPQMCCKMALKTSEEMPVHGSDAIHLAFDAPTDTLSLYWGEAKLYGKFADALDEVCTSITAFSTPKAGKTPRDRDINILCDHMNMEDGPAKTAILRYFDPYAEEHNNLREVFACFVGFDFAFFDKLAGVDKAKAEDEFKKEYLDRIDSACKLFAKKIKANNMHTLNFHFFLIPFPCVDKLRELYLQKLQG